MEKIHFSSICRICLGNRNLYPILKNNVINNKYSTFISSTSGIEVEPNDGLPQNICKTCITFINKFMKFKLLCKQNVNKLLKIKNKVNRKTNKEKYSIKVGQIFDHFDEDIGISKTEFSGENIKIESTDKKYNHEESYNHNEMAYNDNINLEHYNNDLSDRETENVKSCSDIDSNNGKAYNDSKELCDETNKTTSYNQNNSNNETAYNHTELSYRTDLKTKYMILTKNNRVMCQICSKNLALRSFDMHIWKCHPGVDERKILCHFCNEYITRNRMKSHVGKHGDNFICVYCNNEYENKEALIQHTISCTHKLKKRKPCETSKELKECDICHKIMQKGSLKLHKEVKHAGLGPICEHCNKKFSNKFRLMEHLRAKHGYDKFKCKLCEFETASEMSMKNHERRHSGIKPFLCEKCGAKFHAAYLLAQHRQSHTTDKIYKCDQCPASFKTNNSLHMHKMTCHSKKTLNCSICMKVYNCRHYLVKHMRGVHRYSGPIGNLGEA